MVIFIENSPLLNFFTANIIFAIMNKQVTQNFIPEVIVSFEFDFRCIFLMNFVLK